MALLEIDGVSFSAGPDGKAAILSGLCLAIEAGEVHALLGSNGTGKSTLGSLIMGCEGYRPSGGTIRFNGEVINDRPLHERARLGITMAWQEPVRFEGISVCDYLTVKRRDADVNACLRLVGISPETCVNRMVDKALSGGERKRIELASVLALRPRLAILDEPDSGIDMLSIQDVINVIAAFKRYGAAVLLITHRDEIAGIADRASQLCGGRIICAGSPDNVAEHYKQRRCLTCEKGGCHYV